MLGFRLFSFVRTMNKFYKLASELMLCLSLRWRLHVLIDQCLDLLHRHERE